MNAVIEAAQILRVDEPSLFQRAYDWSYGPAGDHGGSARRLYEQYRQTKVYPPCVLAFVAAVRRSGKVV
jgi:hypothetical protein